MGKLGRVEPVLCFLWSRTETEKENLPTKVCNRKASRADCFECSISGMETVLVKMKRRTVVKQNLELVLAGAHGDLGLVVLQPVEREPRQERELVEHNLQDLVY